MPEFDDHSRKPGGLAAVVAAKVGSITGTVSARRDAFCQPHRSGHGAFALTGARAGLQVASAERRPPTGLGRAWIHSRQKFIMTRVAVAGPVAANRYRCE